MKSLFIRKPHRSLMDQLEIHKKGEVVYLTSPVLSGIQGIRHAFSTRYGGISAGDLSSMNLGFAREKDPETVRENYRLLGEAVGFNEQQTIWTSQTHTTNVRRVTKAETGCGLFRERPYQDVDGLITNESGCVLVCFMADCVPVLLADPKKHAVGCIHSGWRGTVHNIENSVIEELHKAYDSDPSDLYAAIGPSICSDCYEVGEEVMQAFAQAYPEKYHSQLFRPGRESHFQLDLWSAVRINLIEAGVPAGHIGVTDICTRCNSNHLYSHRAHGLARGSLAGLIELV